MAGDAEFVDSLIPRDRVGLTDLAQRLDLNISTIFRWAQRGVRPRSGGERVRLRIRRVGGRSFVQRADLEEFFDEVNGDRGMPKEELPAVRTRRRQTEIDRAKTSLSRDGVQVTPSGSALETR